ncbi:MAG: hypothetical protein C5B50_12810 [Verrucomicrobia bacterium]|nr:MAG: hypothetical protein C5B50_12810 [Verrucomicrobiota bacterium]
MTTKNPFPGMNPFFEQRWRDAHHALLSYVRDTLQERLPADLVVWAEEEEVVMMGPGKATKTYRPDVQVREPWKLQEPDGTAVATDPRAPPATEPIRVYLDEEVERWLEIREARGRLITVIELLSPTNKLATEDRDRYLQRRRNFIGGGANFVEIDLVRQGKWVFPAPVQSVLQREGAAYGACVIRAIRPAEQDVYPIRLRERLPVIRIPLRPTDPDVVLDIQPLVDQCHERGRYHLLDYGQSLEPQLAPEDAAWADQILREQNLV